MPAPHAGWRQHLRIHPAADLFPLISPAELKELGDDIKANGLLQPIVLWCDGDDYQLLDGRNRLDAMEAVGMKPAKNPKAADLFGLFADVSMTVVEAPIDPLDYVVSVNLRRRHLTAEQKRDLIAELLRLRPDRSNRQTAKIAQVDDKTVGAVRTEMERRAEIPHVSTTTDAKGRAQPAHKPKASPPSPAPATPPPVKQEAPPSPPSAATSPPADPLITRLEVIRAELANLPFADLANDKRPRFAEMRDRVVSGLREMIDIAKTPEKPSAQIARPPVVVNAVPPEVKVDPTTFRVTTPLLALGTEICRIVQESDNAHDMIWASKFAKELTTYTKKHIELPCRRPSMTPAVFEAKVDALKTPLLKVWQNLTPDLQGLIAATAQKLGHDVELAAIVGDLPADESQPASVQREPMFDD
jgi:hypothetical protein